MGRVLQCLVCITAMMSSGLSQRGFFQHPSQVAYPANPYEGLQDRNSEYRQPITTNLYTRTPEARKHRIVITHEHIRIENGTYPHINKRGTLEKLGSELNDRVVFPGPTSNEPSTKNPEDPRITEECKKRGYCGSNEVLNYPDEDVANLVIELGDKVKDFQMDALDDDVQIAQRLGGTGELEIPLCSINETIIYPGSLPDKNGKWWFVMNQDKPLQGFLAEMCKTENSSCNAIAKIQNGYKSICKQKFVYRMVNVVERGKHSQQLLRLPGCCSCVITTENNPFAQ